MMLTVFAGFALLASAIVANKYILGFLPHIFFAGIRMLAAGVLLTIILWPRSKRLRWSYLKNDWLIVGAISLTTALPAVLKAYALQNMVSSKATYLGSLDPFITALYAYLLWGEKLTMQKIVGIIIGALGILVLLFSTSPVEESLRAWGVLSYPELSALLAMPIGRFGWILVQKVLRENRYSAREINCLTWLVSGVLCLGFGWWYGEVLPTELTLTSHSIILFFLYTVIIGNIIALTMYAEFLKHHSATFISLAGFSVPLYVYFYGWLLLGEPLSLNFVISSAITLFGLLIFYHDEIKKGIY